MTERHSRRQFVKWVAGALAGAGTLPLFDTRRLRGSTAPGVGGPTVSTAGRGRRPRPARDGLPPRAVGLRSRGGDFAFDPPGLRLDPGDELTWLNMGDFHTATAFHPDNADLLPGEVPLRIPEGAEPWHSGMLGLTSGTEFTYGFEVPGVYDYFCQPHYSFGMVGRIVVPPEDGPAPSARPAAELNEASRAEMPTVEAILGPPGRAFEWAARVNGVLLLRAHGEAAGEAAERMGEALTGDEELAGLLDRTGRARAAEAALERFLDGARTGTGYETLLGRADELKSQLSAAVEAG